MKNLSLSLLTTIAVQALNLVGGIVTARNLLPEGRGLLASSILWPGLFATIGSLSFDYGVLHYSATERNSARSIFTSGLVVAVLLSAATTIAGFFLVSVIIGDNKEYITDNTRICLIFIPCTLIGLTASNWLSGTSQFPRFNILRVMPSLLPLLGTFVCLIAGLTTVRAFLVAFVAGHLGVLGVSVFLCRHAFGMPKIPYAAAILKYGAGMHLATLTTLAAARIDQSIIALYLPPDRLGLYVVAMTIAMTTTLGGGTVQLLTFPKIVDQPTALGKLTMLRRCTWATVMLTVGAGIFVVIAAPSLVPALYGRAFLPTLQLVSILLVGTIPSALSGVLLVAFRAYGKIGIVIQATFVNFLVAALALIMLVSGYGVVGAAWAYAIAQCTTTIFLMSRLNKALNLRLSQIFEINQSDIDLLIRTFIGLRSKLL